MILDKLSALEYCTAIATDPSGLIAIENPACAATVWQRTPLPRFQRWIDALPPEQLPRARVILRPESVCDALINIAHQCGTPKSSECDLLIEDASALSSIFANLMGTTYLRLRFDVIKQMPVASSMSMP